MTLTHPYPNCNPSPNSNPYARHHLVDALQLPPVAPAGEPNRDPTPSLILILVDPTPSLHANTRHSTPIQLYLALPSCQPIANPQVSSLTKLSEKPYPKQSLEQNPKPPLTPIPPQARSHPRLNPGPDLPYTLYLPEKQEGALKDCWMVEQMFPAPPPVDVDSRDGTPQIASQEAKA